MFTNESLTVSIKHFLEHSLWKVEAYVSLCLLSLTASDTVNSGHGWKALWFSSGLEQLFWGSITVLCCPLGDLNSCLMKNKLFRGSLWKLSPERSFIPGWVTYLCHSYRKVLLFLDIFKPLNPIYLRLNKVWAVETNCVTRSPLKLLSLTQCSSSSSLTGQADREGNECLLCPLGLPSPL